MAALDAEDDIRRELSRTGLSCPDLLFVGTTHEARLVLQPVDSKVSLDTASADQVQAIRVFDLVHHGGPLLHQAIAIAVSVATNVSQSVTPPSAYLAELFDRGEVDVVDGFFASPNTGFNRKHLESASNRRRRRPLTDDDVRLIDVDERRYLSGLPGWEESLLLRRLDGLGDEPTVDLSLAERYYRMGSGIASAVAMLEQPLFGERRDVDTFSLAQRRIAQGEVETSVDLFVELGDEVTGRRVPLERRRRLERYPIPFRELLSRAARLTPGTSPAVDNVRRLYDTLSERYRTSLHQRGADLLAAGAAEHEVLSQLEREAAARQATAAAELETLFRQRAPSPMRVPCTHE